MPEKFLPIAQPDISEAEIAEVAETLRSGWLTYGPRTQELEESFAAFAGARYAVGLNSCTAGMHLALLAAGIGPGDEVITTPLTFCATVNVIVHVGATPVLADIDSEDLNLAPQAVAAKVSAKTRAILPMHYAGQPCQMEELLDIAREHELVVIEDAAHALGASYRGKPVGSLGDATCFSFYPTKNMTTGEGGMLTTDDGELAEKARILRKHGLSTDAWKRNRPDGNSFYDVVSPGFNYAMTDLQAALGKGQLTRLRDMNAARARIAGRYADGFAGVEQIEVPAVREDVVHAWHLYPIRLRLERLRIDRNLFEAQLRQRSIGTAVNFIPIHYHAFYKEGFNFRRGDYPVAETEFERLLSLPLYPGLTEDEVDQVVEAVVEVATQNVA